MSLSKPKNSMMLSSRIHGPSVSVSSFQCRCVQGYIDLTLGNARGSVCGQTARRSTGGGA